MMACFAPKDFCLAIVLTIHMCMYYLYSSPRAPTTGRMCSFTRCVQAPTNRLRARTVAHDTNVITCVCASQADDGHFIPRALLFDLEPGVVKNRLGRSAQRNLFNPENIFNAQSGAGNNWAKGYAAAEGYYGVQRRGPS